MAETHLGRRRTNGSVTLDVRRRIGAQVFERVAGTDGAAKRARIHFSEGERWFAPDRPIRTVHGDASIFVGGLRALLLQSLHPLAMGRSGRAFGLPRRTRGGGCSARRTSWP